MADSKSGARNIQDDLKYLDVPESKERPFYNVRRLWSQLERSAHWPKAGQRISRRKKIIINRNPTNIFIFCNDI